MVTGEKKGEKIMEIMEKKGVSDRYPASHVSPENAELYWFLDKSAAAQISIW
jgi:6-phosphogluconolactonase/glucosamine-6-phosphate isomerase/deaminase